MDSISFGSRLDDEVAKRTRDKRGDQGWWKWNVFGEVEKATEAAQDEIFEEKRALEVRTAADRATLEVNQKHFVEMQAAIAETKEARQRAEAAFDEAQKAKDATIIEQNRVVEATQQLADEREKLAQKYSGLLEEQKQATAEHEAQNRKLIEKMEAAMKQKDEAVQAQLKQQQQAMQEMYEKQMERLSSQMRNVSATEANFRAMQDTNNLEGFAKVAGYEQQKKILVDHVGTPIALERSGKPAIVPNGILFFGPQGCGKTTFAEAFAGQLGCRNVKIPNLLNDELNNANLMEEAAKAQKHFEETGIRTILQVDEFDGFAPKGSRITGALKDFMGDVSNRYHCTVFATTNHPEEIDPTLLRDGRFDVKAGLPPAGKADTAAILKHHGETFADGKVNYDELAAEIVKKQPDEAFSNARIASVVTRFVNRCTNAAKMTQDDFLSSIRDVGPDIAKDALEKFTHELEYMRRV